jgi:adenosylmethionine-8-amino-7-oxononanoate aminotransferase
MLVDITPKGLEKVFFADNGSSGVEVALKMSYHYYKNQGQSRKYFVSLTNSYHGETIGALSVSDVGLYKEVYSDILIKSLHAKVPKDTTKKQTKIALEDMQKMFEKYKNNISSVIIEPLVQCAGDMHMYDSSYLSGLRKLCTKYDILLIADEVAVGFGRTGHFFACNSADICPDIMVLSKALTGGYMALSAVMLKQNIYDMFYHPYKNISKAFLHSHSYTGNPLACTAAIATIKYMKKHDILKKNEPKIELMKKLSKKYKKLSNVTNIRQTGMIFAFDVTGYESSKRIGVYIHKEALKQGLLIRPLGNTVYFMPIYIISTKQIKYMFETVYDIIEKLEKTAQKQIKSEKK